MIEELFEQEGPLAVLRMVIRLHMDELTPQEFMVYMWIFNRTIMFGKLSEHIPMRHFTHGLIDKNGLILAKKLPMGQRQIHRIVQNLKHKGFLQTFAQRKSATMYTIKTPNSGEKTPKNDENLDCHIRQGVLSKMTVGTVKNDTSILTLDTKHKKITNTHYVRVRARAHTREKTPMKSEKPNLQHTPKNRLLNLQHTLINKNKEAHSARLSKPTADAIKQTFYDAMKKFYPNAKNVELTKKTSAMLTRVLKRLPADVDRKNFMKFCVEFWDRVQILYLHRPESALIRTPTINYLVKSIDGYHEAYQDHLGGGLSGEKLSLKSSEEYNMLIAENDKLLERAKKAEQELQHQKLKTKKAIELAVKEGNDQKHERRRREAEKFKSKFRKLRNSETPEADAEKILNDPAWEELEKIYEQPDNETIPRSPRTKRRSLGRGVRKKRGR